MSALLCAAGCEVEAGGSGLCQRCEHLLAGMCLGKKRHWRLRNAQMAAAAFDGEAAYPCLVCGRYHVGTVKAHRLELDEQRRDVVRRLRSAGRGALLTVLAERWSEASRTRWKMTRGAES